MDFWVILAFLAGICATVLFFWFSNRRALSIVRTKASAKGIEAKKDAADDLMSFLAEAAEIFNKAKSENLDLKATAIKELPALIARHPRTAIRFGKRLYELVQGGEGGGLESFLSSGIMGGESA